MIRTRAGEGLFLAAATKDYVTDDLVNGCATIGAAYNFTATKNVQSIVVANDNSGVVTIRSNTVPVVEMILTPGNGPEVHLVHIRQAYSFQRVRLSAGSAHLQIHRIRIWFLRSVASVYSVFGLCIAYTCSNAPANSFALNVCKSSTCSPIPIK